MKPIAAGLLACLLLPACAYVTSVPVGADNADEKGIRYNSLRPILVVAGGQANIKYIPDPSREHALRFGAFLAKNNMDVKLADQGALSQLASDMDATASVGGLFDIANKLVEAALPSTGEVSSGLVGGAGDVRIFDFVFAPDGTIVGLRELKNIPLGKVASVPTLSGAGIVSGIASGDTSGKPDITKPGVES